MPDPNSPDDWRALALRQEASARHLLDGAFTGDAFFHAGISVEAMLKAAVMKHEGLNRWPDRSDRRELYSHNLVRLAGLAGVEIFDLAHDPIAPRWQVVRLWKRAEAYDPAVMPLRVARDMVEAACGSEGVNRWIEHRFRLDR